MAVSTAGIREHHAIVEEEPVVRLYVWYAPNPAYKGDHHANMKKGLQGSFDSEEEARAAAEKCKAWFTVKREILKIEGKDGRVRDEIKETIHDNVIVWIDKYIDGEMVESAGKPIIRPKSAVRPKEEEKVPA